MIAFLHYAVFAYNTIVAEYFLKLFQYCMLLQVIYSHSNFFFFFDNFINTHGN